MNRTTLLLLFGGESSEHDVSVSSARNVYAAMDDAKYEVLLGYIDRQGRWWLIENLGEQIITHGPQLMPALGAGGFVTMPHNRIIKPDVIVPILHGKNGEDGSVQGLAQLLHIPIVGSDMTASAICMDKLATKEILAAHHIPVVPYEVHREGQTIDFNKLSMQLGSPLFVKPSRSGSSIGVNKVNSEDELVPALQNAHHHDKTVLIEAAIVGREIEVAILGNPPRHRASVLGEIKPDRDFYDYEAKYNPDSRLQVVIPAELGSAVTDKIRRFALNSYEIIGCTGLARVDFFVRDDGTIYLNELNTIPGFTSTSMYPKLWRHGGISYSDLIDHLISLALHGTIKSNEMEV